MANARLPIQIYALTVAAFAIGTTEFVIMGLLPDIARDLSVSIPMAGYLVTGYALGVVVGAPILTLGTGRMQRKNLLTGLMSLFILGNVMAALAPNYQILMIARVVAAFTHGTFFGVGAVVAAGLVAPERRASAIALMFTGLALANILGVPAGTAIGQAFGWRATFWCVSALGIASGLAVYWLVKPVDAHADVDIRSELRVLRRPDLWIALATTVLGFGGVFVVLTFIAPILLDVTGFDPHEITIAMLVFGVGLVIGNTLGGRAADRALMPALIGILAALVAVLLVFTWTMQATAAAYVTIFVWGIVAFATISPLQTRVVQTAQEAPSLASSLNIAGFNLGNAGGAFVGAELIDAGYGYAALTIAGAAICGGGLLLAAIGARRDRVAAAGLAE